MPDVPDVFERLMSLHHETFEAAHYNTAYHVLAAALHCADDEHSLEHLVHVNALAMQQLKWIDGHAPAYEHSTVSAATRGNSSIYSMLAKQAQAKVVMLRHQQRRKTPSTFWPGDNTSRVI